ncbi:AraC family transcriptional regulator [Neiella marina]|uniref:AraC family transcriptional regulator n=2 Tax=Neiella holothuriorum TaxID=2870530 RepID=A0ABS7EBL9_9GAMM|nr:AraC family transcriptional regulator [Neiella holothuriorum]
MQSYVDSQRLNSLEGVAETTVPGVRFYRSTTGCERQPLLYQSGIIILGQGSKTIHLADQHVDYGAGDYLVLGVPMPIECEAFALQQQPLLGLNIDVDPTLLHQQVDQLLRFGNGHPCQRCNPELGLRAAQLDARLADAVARLLTALQTDAEASIIGPAIVAEIIYFTLVGPNGHVLFDLAQHDGHYARIARVLNRIHAAYADNLTVDELATSANMSVSAFHRAFRQVTRESPLQYLKKVRLNKAKELIVNEGKRASDAAHQVGYSSPSQFSREFKRHFKATPKALLN